MFRFIGTFTKNMIYIIFISTLFHELCTLFTVRGLNLGLNKALSVKEEVVNVIR